MNRGSRHPQALADRHTFRFNEAPIHESGKSDQATQAITAQAGFNEAPIHESGKLR